MSNKKITEIDFVRSVLMCIVILVHIVSLGELYPSAKTAALNRSNPRQFPQLVVASTTSKASRCKARSTSSPPVSISLMERKYLRNN